MSCRVFQQVTIRSPHYWRWCCSKRPFFASSTDHTRLLADAEVHHFSAAAHGDNVQQYIMAAAGVDLATIQKVPQLHLARLFVENDTNNGGHTLFGAKVINRTLGSVPDVCGKLVDAALNDIAGGHAAKARSALHGLSDWVLEGIRIVQQDGGAAGEDEVGHHHHASLAVLSDLSPDSDEWKAVEAIASSSSGLVDETIYNPGREAWEQLAHEFVAQGLSEEATLYQSKGATFSAIEHRADTTVFAETSGGAMALFSF